MLSTIGLPEHEGNEEDSAEDERSQDVRRAPRVLVAVLESAKIHVCPFEMVAYPPHCMPIMKRIMPTTESAPPT